MYAPFAMMFPEESDQHKLVFELDSGNPFGLPAGSYELYDIYPPVQEAPIYDIFLNVVNEQLEILATLYCQLNLSEHEIYLNLSEIHLQHALAPALQSAVESEFESARGQKWADWLLMRAERMQSAFIENLKTQSNTGLSARLLKDEALDMLLEQSDDPYQQEVLIEGLLYEMRQMLLVELENHRRKRQQTAGNNIIRFPGPRRPNWNQAHWLDLHIALRELPEIWRKISVPDCLTLTQLHQVLQLVMGWQNQAWRFVHPSGEYGPAEQLKLGSQTELFIDKAADTTLLKDLLQRKGARLDYQYTANWYHQLRVSQRHKPGELPLVLVCLEGALASPPEDCGGPEGYSQLQHILGKKRQSRADKLLLAEIGAFDPLKFDEKSLNQALLALGQEFQQL